ncbi:MAG: hypothetical protein M1827_003022 [Pycnora praestabilis]|nr:MAG: hypothetical protein M1827_003022 [Pycnora praestabilis]
MAEIRSLIVSAEIQNERKQRLCEYRVASRREKRNRKSDEKKQRNLNATILRRMTQNPDENNRNAERNRFGEVETERRKIWAERVKQAQRLAAIHDPSGAKFNVSAVTTLDDGTVDTREESSLEPTHKADLDNGDSPGLSFQTEKQPPLQNGINPERLALMKPPTTCEKPQRVSKSHQKKLDSFAARPPPPKHSFPPVYKFLTVKRTGLLSERKALREKQKEGKAERRAARDERGKVYREMKLTWKAIKEEKQQKRRIQNIEQEEVKRMAVEINTAERKEAFTRCAELGFTLENTLGVSDIKPRVLGMKGAEIDWERFERMEKAGEKADKIKAKFLGSGKDRVNLGAISDESKAKVLGLSKNDDEAPGEFIPLNIEQDPADMNYNHNVQRKLHRALEAAQVEKAMLVRQKALEYCGPNEIEPPEVLITAYKPVKINGQRALEDGTLETEKQERVRARMELAEYNQAAMVLRRQAREQATKAGLRKYAELTGKSLESNAIPKEILKDGVSDVFSFLEISLKVQLVLEKKSKSGRKRTRDSNSNDLADDQKTSKKVKSRNTGNVNVKSISINSVPEEPSKEERRRRRKEKKEAKEALQEHSEDTISVLEKVNGTKDEERASPIADVRGDAMKHKQRQKEKEHNEKEDQNDHQAEVKKQTLEETKSTGTAVNWNSEALSGDAARKEKLLRLLGVAKPQLGHQTLCTNGSTSSSLNDLSRRDADLEKQYDAGLRLKQDGKRKGLGA